MGNCCSESERINSFALVTYIPDPLARFLDALRRELVDGCDSRAHVTILPPRPVSGDPEAAWEYVRNHLKDQPAFDVEAGRIEVFERTSVVYVSLASGCAELERMHDLLNSGPVWLDEPFVYQPHITVAQQFPAERVREVRDLAERRWSEYRGPRQFSADRVTFVQNTTDNCWLDLAELRLVTPAFCR